MNQYIIKKIKNSINLNCLNYINNINNINKQLDKNDILSKYNKIEITCFLDRNNKIYFSKVVCEKKFELCEKYEIGITDLAIIPKSISVFSNLHNLFIYYHSIIRGSLKLDISSLVKLTNLTYLELENNDISRNQITKLEKILVNTDISYW